MNSDKLDILFTGLQNCSLVEELCINLARNDLIDRSLINLSKILCYFENLKKLELHLYGNKFSESALLTLLDQIQK